MFNEINVGDTVNGLEVTKTTDKSCWLEGKRYTWQTINKLIDGGCAKQSKFNLNIQVDWTNKEKVLNYYNSFKQWIFYISMGDSMNAKSIIFQVKDNLVFHDGEFWLPAPQSSPSMPNAKSPHIEDGDYMGMLIKKNNSWFGNKTNNYSNVFVINHKVNINPTIDDIKKLVPNSTELYVYPHQGEIRLDYSHSGREGLSINSIYVYDFKQLFINTYCRERFGRRLDKIVLSDEQLSKIMYDDDTFLSRLNDVLSKAKYDIYDDEEYGYYTLKYVVISKEDSEKFFAVIEENLKSLK